MVFAAKIEFFSVRKLLLPVYNNNKQRRLRGQQAHNGIVTARKEGMTPLTKSIGHPVQKLKVSQQGMTIFINSDL
jgi:hypothetical protein